VTEGQTEETFVNLVLAPYLAEKEILATAHCVTTKRKKGRVWRGGMRSYQRVRRDIDLWFRSDGKHEARFTTFLDLYGLPNDFPGYEKSRRLTDPYEKVAVIENAMAEDFEDWRFTPYIQLHEFEALVLVNPRKLEHEFMDHEEGILRLEALVAEFASPEEIDEGQETAPSKRIVRELPEYKGRKATAGPRVVEKIGLPLLREKCRHFDGWLSKLEALAEA